MSFHWSDNIHTTVFTPRDYQVELLATAFEGNTMICLGHKSSKEFIALKLLQELAKDTRSLHKFCVYLTCNGAQSMYSMLQHLTDLKVYYQEHIEDCSEKLPSGYEVYIVSPISFHSALRKGAIALRHVQLIVLEDCHEANVYKDLLPIFKEFYSSTNGCELPKVLGLSGPLHSAGCDLSQLSAMLKTLEENVCCRAETASDIVTVLRYCSKPIEYILQCAPHNRNELTSVLEDVICTRIAFLNDHRYDPSEIYNTEELLEELKDIPDPKKLPLEFLNTILEVLHEMGPWCADRVAVSMFHRIEKQKLMTPHERHYILLCLVNTALFEIHAICEQVFHKYSNHKELIFQYSSPKVQRLLEVLRLFKPNELVTENETIRKINQDLDGIDFRKLGRSLEYSCQHVENVTKQQLESRSIVDNLDPIVHMVAMNRTQPLTSITSNSTKLIKRNQVTTRSTECTRRVTQARQKRRPGFIRRQNREHPGDPSDTLCALIFCNFNHTARVLFDLISEMSRHDTDLKFLKCQYTTDRVADPLTEPKEAELEHRRQEEVLKRFRMHDCNVLIGTAILEEGIDLPKCNLVIRWDPPKTYRSYVQCKGRARAVPAYHIILVAPKFDVESHSKINMNEQLNNRSHRFLCKVDDSIEDDSADSDISNDDQEKHINKFTIGSSKGIVKILNPEVITNIPPTTSEIILKEIRDETLAIEMPPVESCTHSNTECASVTLNAGDETAYNINENDLSADNINNISSNSHSTQIDQFSDCFEILDVSSLTSTRESSENKKEINSKSVDEDGGKGCSVSETLKIGNDASTENTNKTSEREKLKFHCCVEEPEEGTEKYDTFAYNGMDLMDKTTNEMVNQLAQYREIEKMLLRKCANSEPPEQDHQLADDFTNSIAAYKPHPELLTGASVDLSSAIALVNKYCSKLPSDTFTKLTPLWRSAKGERNGLPVFQYTLRLPINSPLKYDIVGIPMPTEVLARRIVALQTCRELHLSGELDDNLQPIGKEGFKAIEPDWENFVLEEQDEKIVQENSDPRPGTTKRRQYYYKRIASEFCDCRPTAGTPCYLYFIDLTLQCPIPEEQNTRGRKIYPPEEAQQGFGILTLKKIPKVSSFPIFTRSGEVKVSIRLSTEMITLTESQIRCINTFLNYTFTNVLRLQKFLMLFDRDSTENCVFIVPTIKSSGVRDGRVIDWEFLDLIERNASMMPTVISDSVRRAQEFDSSKFKDAVVMPWYRNQDQPQYFYVAEICPQLTPLSCFPGENYRTFKHYYYLKYGITIQNAKQPLLDVDHTSARLNFLTPRYVNRKGVALPTSSEETKRAKRENLEQKQILVPELCTVHPFPASLWRTAVCLPCILYRINGLLLADDIRKKVSHDIGLGLQEIEGDFEWPMLDFGWSLSEVLRKSKEAAQKHEHLTEPVVENGFSPEQEPIKEEKFFETKIENSIPKIEKSANEIVIEAEKQLKDTAFIEIGTWSNDMADDLNSKKSDNEEDEEEYMKFFPSNVSFCDGSLADKLEDPPVRCGSPTFWNVQDENRNNNNFTKTSSAFTCYDSDDSYASSYDGGFGNSVYNSEDEDDDDNGTLRIAFTSKNEAETIETEQEIEKRNKQLSIIQDTTANERNYQETKNLQVGYNFSDLDSDPKITISIAEFQTSTEQLKEEIQKSGMLVEYNKCLKLPKKEYQIEKRRLLKEMLIDILQIILPNTTSTAIEELLKTRPDALTIEDIQNFNLMYVKNNPDERFTIVGCGDVFDRFNDKSNLEFVKRNNALCKQIKLNFESQLSLTKQFYIENHSKHLTSDNHWQDANSGSKRFSFDYQPNLVDHPGPSTSIILQALTMSNANDGINLERLETIGDSFLKYAITTYLYITYDNVHEGKLSHLRSKQVANLNLYRLGRRKMLGEYMIATKFEPHDNWLPPCYYVPKELEKALIEAKIPPHHWKLIDLQNIKKLTSSEICEMVRQKADSLGLFNDDQMCVDDLYCPDKTDDGNDFTCFIPYNLVTQHSIPDKSVADCVEALIGAYLIECGSRGALIFMAWLGIRVLPMIQKPYDPKEKRLPGTTNPDANNMITVYGEWKPPKSPLLHYSPNSNQELESLLDGFDEFEATLGYKFRDRSYLLQAMTHASYSPNRLTDCYQRLEFLGDAVLDYLITRHLYEDPRQHSPGALTDLRSALVNNTIFASLAVRHGFHKYFRHLSPGLNEVINRFVRIQNENGHSISEEYYLLSEEECDDAEDVEVPKALGDVFESIAGAIFLDSNMSLDVVWQVYSNMMKPEIEQFSNSVPKSPIRELLELEPETAKFGKPEKLADGRRVRVTVEVFSKGTFRGIGRNYRIAKCTAAKCALRQLKKQGLMTKKE